jgi:hypothetical protein
MGAERDQQKNWACTKTKTDCDVGFDSEIFEKD